MAASIKISELNSLNNLTDVDLFLVSDMETGTSRKISYTDLKSNITSDTTSALSNLTNVVSQNRTDAEALVETIRVDLQASIDGNTTSFSAGDDQLEANLTAYKNHIEERNLELALAFDVPTYAEIIYGG